MSDTRHGKPSASAMPALELCKGRWNATKDIPSVQTADGKEGDIIHAELAETFEGTLTPEQLETADRCRTLVTETAEALYGGIDDADTLERERRLFMYDKAGDVIVSGKPDLVGIWGTRALIVDYKTGRNEVPTAARNAQLRSLAVLLDIEEGGDLSEVTVAVIQPWASPQVNQCTYTTDDLSEATGWLLDLLAEVQSPDAVRTPGVEQCRYCQAKTRCPQALGTVTTLAVHEDSSGLAEFTPKLMAKALNHCTVAEGVIKDIRAQAKERITADPEAIPGWRLRSTGTVRTVTDVGKLFLRLAKDYGVTPAQFTSLCKFTLGSTEGLVKEQSGMKGKVLKSAVDAVLEGLVEEEPKAPALAREK